MEQYHKI